MEPDGCEYADKCSQKGISCEICRHNKGKRSYFEPDNPQPIIWIHEPIIDERYYRYPYKPRMYYKTTEWM